MKVCKRDLLSTSRLGTVITCVWHSRKRGVRHMYTLLMPYQDKNGQRFPVLQFKLCHSRSENHNGDLFVPDLTKRFDLCNLILRWYEGQKPISYKTQFYPIKELQLSKNSDIWHIRGFSGRYSLKLSGIFLHNILSEIPVNVGKRRHLSKMQFPGYVWIKVLSTWNDCVNYGKYIPPDLGNFLGCTKLAKQVTIAGAHNLELGIWSCLWV